MYVFSFIEDEGDLALYAMKLRDTDPTNREGPCEDDCEVTCPLIGRLPNESGKVDGSPLRFQSPIEIDQQIQAAFERGL